MPKAFLILSFNIPIKLNLIQKQAKARYNQKFFRPCSFLVKKGLTTTRRMDEAL